MAVGSYFYVRKSHQNFSRSVSELTELDEIAGAFSEFARGVARNVSERMKVTHILKNSPEGLHGTYENV